MTLYRRVLFAVLAVALLACAYVGVARYRYEHASKHVELAMDYPDFIALSRSYGINPLRFLIALRKAGLTSLAIPEELGSTVNGSKAAIAFDGQTLIDQSRIAPLNDPFLRALAARKQLSPLFVYLIVYDPVEYHRYLEQTRIHFGLRAVHVLHDSLPYVLAIRSQTDFFNATGLGIPDDQIALANAAGLYLVPRIQNEERFDQVRIDAIFNAFMRHADRASTVIFFGTRNQVLGYPDHFEQAGRTFKRTHLNYGSVEYYVPTQDQAGNEDLARTIPGQTTRVLAIARPELDQLSPETVIARYLLGVRERNIRVAYLRPLTHLWVIKGKPAKTLSIVATNLEVVRRIAAGLRSTGYALGRATPIPDFRVNPAVIAVATLAVPALFLLLLDTYGFASLEWAVALCALDLIFFGAALFLNHEMAARKLIALSGALLFPIAGAVAIAPSFCDDTRRSFAAALREGLRLLAIAIGVTLGGALVIVGLLSTPLMMEEIDRFTGVKLVLIVPPLIVLMLAVATARFGASPGGARATISSPVRVYQLILGVVLLAVAYLVLVRSGNDSDVAPSAFELAFRQHLTTLLSVRPRFKEFLLGYPLLVLLPALTRKDIMRFGWLIALGVGVGLADISDTFSHVHTALVVSMLRVFNGAVIGVIVGAIAVYVYLLVRPRLPE